MNKKQCFILVLLLVLMLISCSKAEIQLQDGYYTAEMDDFDPFGWKDYITIRVSGGKIIHVEYDSYNSSGLTKSWDMDYMRSMNEVSGSYPNSYTRTYGEKLLETQSCEKIDCVTGATYSHRVFTMLARAALENARAGITDTRLVDIFTGQTEIQKNYKNE